MHGFEPWSCCFFIHEIVVLLMSALLWRIVIRDLMLDNLKSHEVIRFEPVLTHVPCLNCIMLSSSNQCLTHSFEGNRAKGKQPNKSVVSSPLKHKFIQLVNANRNSLTQRQFHLSPLSFLGSTAFFMHNSVGKC
jgi:hypothetical protein